MTDSDVRQRVDRPGRMAGAAHDLVGAKLLRPLPRPGTICRSSLIERLARRVAAGIRRDQPPVRTARLRVACEILETGPGDLSLTSQEASSLLRAAEVRLGEDELEAVLNLPRIGAVLAELANSNLRLVPLPAPTCRSRRSPMNGSVSPHTVKSQAMSINRRWVSRPATRWSPDPGNSGSWTARPVSPAGRSSGYLCWCWSCRVARRSAARPGRPVRTFPGRTT